LRWQWDGSVVASNPGRDGNLARRMLDGIEGVMASAWGTVNGDRGGFSWDEELLVYGADVEDPNTDGDGWLDGGDPGAGDDALARDDVSPDTIRDAGKATAMSR
jgi:hypothetical protein